MKKALQQQESSRSLLHGAEASLDRGAIPDKFVRDSSHGKTSGFKQNASIMSSDSRGKTNFSSSKKKDQFFAKHKDSINESTVKTLAKKRESSQEGRNASRDRLYNQETIASILKRNPELGYNAKDKKPPTLPPRRAPPKKKSEKPPTPEPPKEDPPEEPLA